METTKEWLVIANQNAGVGKCGRHWDAISKALNDQKILFDVYFSDYRRHAMELVRQNIPNYSKIIVVGGDGTLNEVINGVFTQNHKSPSEIIIGHIPMGSGNDWGKMYGITDDFEDAIRVIVQGKLFLQDIGKVRFLNFENETEIRYFANIAGLGFDARVVQRSNKQKDYGYGGKLLYFFNLLGSLSQHKSSLISVKTEQAEFTENIFSINIGICRYNGGGMLQVPDAISNDGLFDMTIVKKIAKFDIIKNIKKLYNGRIKTHSKIMTLRAASIEISSKDTIQLEADGEDFGFCPVKFEIIPKAIHMIVKNDTFAPE